MIDRTTYMGALQSAPQLRERLLRRIGSWSWNDEVEVELIERPLSLPITGILLFRFRPNHVISWRASNVRSKRSGDQLQAGLPLIGTLASRDLARSRILSVKTGAQVQFFLQIQPPGLANRKQPRIKSIGPVALYLATDIHNLWQPPNRQSQHMWHSLAICGNRQRGPGYEHPVEGPHSQRAHFPARTIAKLPHSGHSSPV